MYKQNKIYTKFFQLVSIHFSVYIFVLKCFWFTLVWN